jgi:uncharacterized protein YjiS (DUF1127 family)
MTLQRRPTWRAVEGSTVVRLVMPHSALCLATYECDGRASRAQSRMHEEERLLVRMARMVAGCLGQLMDRRRNRLELLDMTDEQLSDIGLRRDVDGRLQLHSSREPR